MIFIIVPFADFQPEEKRPEELKRYISHMKIRILPIHKDPVFILIVEQLRPDIFNRGQLLNIGALEAKKIHPEILQSQDTIVTSDVDMLPNDDIIAEFDIYRTEFDMESLVPKDESLIKIYGFDTIPIGGGLSAVRAKVYFDANGYPNNFWGWGAEDRAFDGRAGKVRRGRIQKGCIQHTDTMRLSGKKKEHLKTKKLKNMMQKEMMKQDSRRWRHNGINNLKRHKIIEVSNDKCQNLTIRHLKVELDPIDYQKVKDFTTKMYDQI